MQQTPSRLFQFFWLLISTSSIVKKKQLSAYTLYTISQIECDFRSWVVPERPPKNKV